MRRKSALKVWKRWIKIPDKDRNSGSSKRMAKEAGMRSMGEVRLAAWLEENGYKYKYEPEQWGYQHSPQKYTPDFKVGDVYLEYKGKMTDQTRKKLISIQKCNPDKDLRLVFERPNNRLRKGAKMTYSEWSERENYLWADQLPTKSWLV